MVKSHPTLPVWAQGQSGSKFFLNGRDLTLNGHTETLCVSSPKVNLKKKKTRNTEGLSLFSGAWEKQAKHFIKHEVALMWWFQSLPATACDRSPRAWHFCAVWIPQNLKLDLTCKRAPGSAFGWFLTPGASEFKSEQADADLCIWVIIVVISCFSYESCFWKLGVEGGALF